MSDRLTPKQFRTLECIIEVGGQTFLLPVWWRDQHHQTLIRRGFLKLRADPFKTKAHMLRGRITPRGRKAVADAPGGVRTRAKADSDRDYRNLVEEIADGLHG